MRAESPSRSDIKSDTRHDEPTNANSPTASSAACGATKPPETPLSHSPLDKGASDRPQGSVGQSTKRACDCEECVRIRVLTLGAGCEILY